MPAADLVPAAGPAPAADPMPAAGPVPTADPMPAADPVPAAVAQPQAMSGRSRSGPAGRDGRQGDDRATVASPYGQPLPRRRVPGGREPPGRRRRRIAAGRHRGHGGVAGTLLGPGLPDAVPGRAPTTPATACPWSSRAPPEAEQAAAGTGTGGDGDGPTGAAPPNGTVGRDDVVSVKGILVHQSIAADVRALLDAAEADGIELGGWGWRDGQTQIRLRRQHCGTSEYAIYHKPSSQCRPPTARPGPVAARAGAGHRLHLRRPIDLHPEQPWLPLAAGTMRRPSA